MFLCLHVTNGHESTKTCMFPCISPISAHLALPLTTITSCVYMLFVDTPHTCTCTCILISIIWFVQVHQGVGVIPELLVEAQPVIAKKRTRTYGHTYGHIMFNQELIGPGKPAREHVTTYTAKFKHGSFFQP